MAERLSHSERRDLRLKRRAQAKKARTLSPEQRLALARAARLRQRRG